MNYLTHFLIDHKKDNPNYNFGLALPDLVNISRRGWRAESQSFPVLNKNVNEIWNGYQQHFAADAQFHNSELFEKHSKRLRKEFEDQGLNQPGIRLFFVGHVLLEMLLDRHIVKTRRGIADMFYDQLNLVIYSDIESFFMAAGDTIPEKFLEFFERFKDSKYLYSYAENEGMFYALNRLLRRTGQPEFEPQHEAAFNDLIMREEIGMGEEIEAFFKGTN
jgi:hypothetical protein